MSLRRCWLMAIGPLVSPLMMAGCDDPAHEQAVQRHVEGMQRALDAFAEEEARRPGNLANTAAVAVEKNQDDLRKIRRDPDIVAGEIQHEFKRFHDSMPQYGRDIEEQLRGDPENIEKTLPKFLY